MRFEKLTDSFAQYSQMVITIENEQYSLEKGNDKAEVILKALKKITKNANEMPAFGVSIDDLTREDMRCGVWLELVFDVPCKYEGMDFDALLIKVEKNNYGFNLIRKNNGKYDGRCFYLSLDGSMDDLYDMITAINK